MTKVKLNLASGSSQERELVTAFNYADVKYVIFDGESTGSMGLPIILVGKEVVGKVVGITDAEEWKKYHPFVVVIPNMVHLSRETILSSTSKKAIFVGRFDYQKRAQEAIRIWSLIRPKYPDWVLDIYGEGELQKDIEDAAKRVGGISVYPPTTFIFDCYQKSSILISTSLFEPFGLVIPEAMSCGLPVVAYDCQYGPADIISDGVDGFLIKQDDINAFVEKLSMLMSSMEMRKRMGDLGIQSAHRFEASQIMPLWQNLFQQLNPSEHHKEFLRKHQ